MENVICFQGGIPFAKGDLKSKIPLPNQTNKEAMKTSRVCLVGVGFFLGALSTAWADPRPPELGVGAIQVTHRNVEGSINRPGYVRSVAFVTVQIYCGGTYGGTYPAGRTVVVEMQEAGKNAVTVYQATLPAIRSSQSYSFTVRLPGPLTRATTMRVRLTPADANPANDVAARTFNPPARNTLTQKANFPFTGKLRR